METQNFTVFCIPPFALIVLLNIMLTKLQCRKLSIVIKTKFLSRRYSLGDPDDQLQPLLAMAGTNN